ncbi:hypothetical protein [Flavicella marina]|uniref:hypothetical protein n=1 Tax=Flavicella marina TaxID=1475951 RepID=UPI001264001D|nr:hypothetical protein [Flavicella marina]
MIAFLHTSKIHIPKFENLVREFNSDIEIQHFVNESLLAEAIEMGEVNQIKFVDQINKIEKTDPMLVICTCSTLGTACDATQNVHRIDRPIANYLSENYKKIGLAFTANSTKLASTVLLSEAAKSQGKSIEIIPIDCSSAWTYYLQNDFERYESEIAKCLLEKQDAVDVVFLAQASMEGAIEKAKGYSKEIYTSPAYGVKTILKQLK